MVIRSGLAAVFLLIFWAPSSHAGIVVMKDGVVHIARVQDNEVTDESITLRWPYKGRGAAKGITRGGSWKLERRLVRWYDAEEDYLTDDYFERYSAKKYALDPAFEKQRTRWIERKQAMRELEIDVIDSVRKLSRSASLVPVPIAREHFEIRKPEGWRTSELPIEGEKGQRAKIFMMVATKARSTYLPRVQVSSVPRPPRASAGQLDWYLEELRRLSRKGVIEVRSGPKETRIDLRRQDFELETVTRRGSESIVALRLVLFRRDRVYFVSCYAEDSEYNSKRTLFRRCIRSLVLFEDERVE